MTESRSSITEYVKDTFFLKLKAIQNIKAAMLIKKVICQRYFFSKIESNSKPLMTSKEDAKYMSKILFF